MKKVLLTVLAALAVTAVALYVFRAPLLEAVAERLTQDMFVDADPDEFDPGLPVGSRLPPVRAMLGAETVPNLDRFAGPNGLVLVANRSAVW